MINPNFGQEAFKPIPPYPGQNTSWCLPSAQMLFKLPAVIHKAGCLLDTISIEICRPSDFKLPASSQELKELSAATQGLKQSTFYCSVEEDFLEEPTEWPPSGLNGLVNYLPAMLDTDALEKVDINMKCLNPHSENISSNKSEPSLGPILTNRIWPNLESVYLTGASLHLSELKNFVGNLRSPISQMKIYTMYLVSGLWDVGLNVLKKGKWIQNLHFGNMAHPYEEEIALEKSGKDYPWGT